MNSASAVLGEDLYDGLATSGFGLFIFTLIIIVLCVIFITTFNNDCKVVSYENNVINVVIQIISITSGVLCLLSILTILGGFNKLPSSVFSFITKPLLKPFWAILCTIISIVFLVSSIWMYRIISAKDFICGKKVDGECDAGYNCIDSFCQSSDTNCTEDCNGNACIGKQNSSGIVYRCANDSTKTCSPQCNIGRTCINQKCQDAKPCTSMDDLSSNPPVYTESHKTLFHCAAGLITMSCIFLVYSIYKLWDWLHETTEQKYEKVNNIIKDFEANPDSITQSKLKAIDDLLSDPSESKDVKEGYKIIASAKEARQKIKNHIENKTRELERIEEANKLNSISDYYIRKYKKETDIEEKKKILFEICTNYASSRADIVSRIKLVVKDGWIENLDVEKLDKLCKNTDKRSSDAIDIDIDSIKEKWTSVESNHAGDSTAEYIEKFKTFLEIIKGIKDSSDLDAIRKHIMTFDTNFFKYFQLTNVEMLNPEITTLITISSGHIYDETSLNILEQFCKSKNIEEYRKNEILANITEKFKYFKGVKDICSYGKDYYSDRRKILEKIELKDKDKTSNYITELNKLIGDFYNAHKAKRGEDNPIDFIKEICAKSTNNDILCFVDNEFPLVSKTQYNKYKEELDSARKRGETIDSTLKQTIFGIAVAPTKLKPGLPQQDVQAQVPPPTKLKPGLPQQDVPAQPEQDVLAQVPVPAQIEEEEKAQAKFRPKNTKQRR